VFLLSYRQVSVHILPYRGLGSGISRALHEWPDIDLIDDAGANQFKVVIPRPKPHVQVIDPSGVGSVESHPLTGEVTGEVGRLLVVLQGEMKRTDLQTALGLRHEEHFREAYLRPALESALIEMTQPDKPRSRLQRYRLTPRGRALQSALNQPDE
jgi:hypothetical protein